MCLQVVQVAAKNVLRVPSKEEQYALADNAKLKDVLVALRSVITSDKADSVGVPLHTLSQYRAPRSQRIWQCLLFQE